MEYNKKSHTTANMIRNASKWVDNAAKDLEMLCEELSKEDQQAGLTSSTGAHPTDALYNEVLHLREHSKKIQEIAATIESRANSNS